MSCNIKTSAEAWNFGVDTFEKAFLSTNGKMDESLNYAISETQNKYPDLDFDVKSFTNPIIEYMKEAGEAPKNYSFGEKQTSYEKKIEAIASKMEGLKPEEKKVFAKQVFSKALTEGYITEDAIKTAYADAMGLPTLTKEVNESIKKMAEANKEFDKIEQEKVDKIKELQDLKAAGTLTPDQDSDIDNELKEIYSRQQQAKENARAAANEIAQQMEPLSFWEWRLFSRANMNLMGIKTLLKNLTGGLADTMLRNMGNAVSSTASTIVSKTLRRNNPLPFGKRALGSLEARKKVTKNVKTAFKTGDTTYNKTLPSYNHMSAATKFKHALDATGIEKVKLFASALLRVSPDAVGRTLAATDQIFNSSIYESELASIAEAKGLIGAEKTAFILSPDEKSQAYAQKKADEATFKDENILTKSSVLSNLKADPLTLYKKFTDPGKDGKPKMSKFQARILSSLFHAASVIVTPFVKTPINIMRQSAKYLLPEVELAKGMIQAKNETDATLRQRIVYDTLGRATVGIMLRNVAMTMVAQGLITAGFKDDDPDSKDTIESVKHGPNRINTTALMRALTFQGVSSKKDDVWVDLSSLGVLGIVMGTYAHAMSKMSEDEKLEAKTPSLGGEAQLALSELQSALDNTFLSGTNQVFEAINDKEGSKGQRAGVNAFMVMMAGIIPATAQTLSTQSNANVKKQFDPDKDFTENLYSALGYKFLAQSKDLKNKYFNLASEEKYGPKKKDYMFFDNYAGRVLEANLDVFKMENVDEGTPEFKLLQEMNKATEDEKGKLFPSAVGDTQTFKAKIKGKTQSFKVQLTTEQHEYLMQQAGKYRLLQATPYIMSEDFDKSSFQVKTDFLKLLYKEGLDMAKKDLLANYPDVKTQRIDQDNKTDKKDIQKLKKKY